MKNIKVYNACDMESENFKGNTVVTIGNFDGLHKGHIKLIKKVSEIKKKEKNIKSVVLGFDINTKKCSNLIYNKGELGKTLKNSDELDIDFLVYLKFIDEVKNLSCDEFVKKYSLDGGGFL